MASASRGLGALAAGVGVLLAPAAPGALAAEPTTERVVSVTSAERQANGAS